MTMLRSQAATDVYSLNHQHPVNRALHAIGIPVVAGCGIAALFGPRVVGASRRSSLIGVAVGAALLFVGHAIEGNRPVILTRREAPIDALRWWSRGATKLCRRLFSA